LKQERTKVETRVWVIFKTPAESAQLLPVRRKDTGTQNTTRSFNISLLKKSFLTLSKERLFLLLKNREEAARSNCGQLLQNAMFYFSFSTINVRPGSWLIMFSFISFPSARLNAALLNPKAACISSGVDLSVKGMAPPLFSST
jgi:hypothetical protein